MVMFSPVLNIIPLSGVLALLITLWINTQINRELLEKLDEVENVTISAVNTSRICGKDLANKTVIAIGIKRSIDYRIKQLRDMNEEYSQQNDTIMAKSNKDTIEDDPVNIPKKIRQNRLQMYGVRITTDILIFETL